MSMSEPPTFGIDARPSTCYWSFNWSLIHQSPSWQTSESLPPSPVGFAFDSPTSLQELSRENPSTSSTWASVHVRHRRRDGGRRVERMGWPQSTRNGDISVFIPRPWRVMALETLVSNSNCGLTISTNNHKKKIDKAGWWLGRCFWAIAIRALLIIKKRRYNHWESFTFT